MDHSAWKVDYFSIANVPFTWQMDHSEMARRPFSMANGPHGKVSGLFSMVNGLFSMPNGPFSMPNGPFSMPNGPFSIANGPFCMANKTHKKKEKNLYIYIAKEKSMIKNVQQIRENILLSSGRKSDNPWSERFKSDIL